MRNKYLISILVPIIILLAMTIQPLMTLFYGQEIKLKTQPVDPTDIFRGDYVILSYEINDLPLSFFPELEKVKDKLEDYEQARKYMNKKVYVLLKPQTADGIYTAAAISFQQPAQGLYLTGKINYFFQKMPPEPSVKPLEPGQPDGTTPAEPVKKEPKYIPDTVKIEYELDKYFVPDNTGTELEEMSRKGQLIATVKIYKGYASLVKVEPE